MTGKIYALGVGPGDKELITLKAHRILGTVGIIVYPAPDTGPSFARSIVDDYIKNWQIEIPIVIPMRLERFPAREIYDKAAVDIAAHLQADRDVAVLCEGDPFFYGSFMYLFERLEGMYEIEVVPGVSSLMACAAALRRPLAARNDALTVIPAPMHNRQILELLERSDAAAIMKIGRHFVRMRELIKQAGLMQAAGYLERVGLENQRIMPLSEVEEDSAPYFSMILIYKGAEGWIQDCEMPTQSGLSA